MDKQNGRRWRVRVEGGADFDALFWIQARGTRRFQVDELRLTGHQNDKNGRVVKGGKRTAIKVVSQCARPDWYLVVCK
jgi:hypothetical protein